MLTFIQIFFISLVVGITFLSVFIFCFSYKKHTVTEDGSSIKELVDYIYQGGLIYVKHQLKSVSIFFLCLCIPYLLVSIYIKSSMIWLPLMIIFGGISSGYVGYISIKHTINSIYRIVGTLNESLQERYNSFVKSGIFITVSILGLILIDIFIWFVLLRHILVENVFNLGQHFFQHNFQMDWSADIFNNSVINNKFHLRIMQFLLVYAFGFSLRTFLSRLNGGIYSVSADITADFVGQTEFDLPEDDLRNPASIADQVGDQIKNSFSFSLQFISTILFSVIILSVFGALIAVLEPDNYSIHLLISPFIILCISILGLILISIIPISYKHSLRAYQDVRLVKFLLTLIFIAVCSYGLVYTNLIPKQAWLAFLMGVSGNVFFVAITALSTSYLRCFVKKLAKKCELGAMSNILYGLTIGFMGTFAILACIIVGMISVFYLSGHTLNIIKDFYNFGFFGLGLVCGMIQVFPFAIGSSSIDNAMGCKKMLTPNDKNIPLLNRFESLASSGVCSVNNIISVSTLISGIMFMFFYVINIKHWLVILSKKAPVAINHIRVIHELEYEASHNMISTADLTIRTVFEIFDVHLLNPKLMIGIIFGAGVVMLAIAVIFHAIESNVSGLTHLVRKEFSEKQGIWEGKELPNYEKLLTFSIMHSHKWMMIITIILFFMPLTVSSLLGVTGAIGFLIGLFVTASVLAFIFNISGTAWKNSQKLIEFEDPDYVGTNKHISACVGSNIGDIFKDGIAPVLTILLQILAMITVFSSIIALRNSHLLQM
jgi:K(+)-stimulated pyrophosphate-energized sodium pump